MSSARIKREGMFRAGVLRGARGKRAFLSLARILTRPTHCVRGKARVFTVGLFGLKEKTAGVKAGSLFE